MARVDYDREMAFIALGTDSHGAIQALGMVDAFVSPDLSEAEFSIMLRSDLKGTGLGKLLMQKIIRYCESRNVRTIVGLVLKKNPGMRGLATRLGFVTSSSDEDDDMVTVTLRLGTA
jgi:acetyltransferase